MSFVHGYNPFPAVCGAAASVFRCATRPPSASYTFVLCILSENCRRKKRALYTYLHFFTQGMARASRGRKGGRNCHSFTIAAAVECCRTSKFQTSSASRSHKSFRSRKETDHAGIGAACLPMEHRIAVLVPRKNGEDFIPGGMGPRGLETAARWGGVFSLFPEGFHLGRGSSYTCVIMLPCFTQYNTYAARTVPLVFSLFNSRHYFRSDESPRISDCFVPARHRKVPQPVWRSQSKRELYRFYMRRRCMRQ
jgi:hypothetical protein